VHSLVSDSMERFTQSSYSLLGFSAGLSIANISLSSADVIEGSAVRRTDLLASFERKGEILPCFERSFLCASDSEG